MTQPPIVRDVLPNGLRLLTERIPHVRSVSVGVWLSRGSRHEAAEVGGIAHFVEHMLFKGTATRSAEDIAQTIDSIGGQMDAFTAKEYASYYIKVLDEHLPRALDVLSDLVLNPAFDPDDVEREKKVILEEIKMVEDTPDDRDYPLDALYAAEGIDPTPVDALPSSYRVPGMPPVLDQGSSPMCVAFASSAKSAGCKYQCSGSSSQKML